MEWELLFEFRKEKLVPYIPYHIFRNISSELILQDYVKPDLEKTLDQSISIEVDNQLHVFFMERLDWDTSYFGITTFKLNYVLYAHHQLAILQKACARFVQQCLSEKNVYLFMEIPSEDIQLIQALNNAGLKLVETRLTYYHAQLHTFNQPRYAVRKANEADIPNLKQVATQMRNEYDRFHADDVFETSIADSFLGTYVEQSINGFADMVITPDESVAPSDSFLTARYLKHEWPILGQPISKMILSAVSATTNKGWYKKLISEMTYLLKEEGATGIFMNTQSTNRAVLHTWHSLGFELGSTSHILSIHNKD